MNKNLIKAFVGQQISNFGDQLFYVAGVFWLYEITGNILQSSLGAIIGHMLGFFLSFFIASIVDSYSKKKLVLIFELVQFLVFITLAILISFKITNIYLIYSLQLATGIAASILNTASQNWSCQFITKDIEKTVNRMTSIRSINSFIFLLIAGKLTSIFTYQEVFLLNAATFMIAFLLELTIEDCTKTQQTLIKIISPPKVFHENYALLVQMYRNNKEFFKVSLLAAIFNFFSVPLGGLIPFLLKISFNKGPDEFSKILMFSTAGIFFASVLYSKINHLLSPLRSIIIAFMVEAILCLLVPLTKNYLEFGVINFLVVFPIYFISIEFNVILRKIGTKDYSKLSNVSESLSSLLIPFGSFMCFHLADTFGPKMIFGIIGICMIVFSIIFLLFQRSFKH